MQPRFTGPDLNLNSFFGSKLDLPPNGPGFYFSGTSASAPNVAAVALLMLQINPDLTPLEIYGILESTAIDMTDIAGFDFDSGYGLVDAAAAINVLQAPVDNKLKTIKKSSKSKKSKAKGKGKGKGKAKSKGVAKAKGMKVRRGI